MPESVEINQTRFGAYITICTNERVYCLPLTQTQIDQLYALAGDLIEKVTAIFKEHSA